MEYLRYNNNNNNNNNTPIVIMQPIISKVTKFKSNHDIEHV
jgi:hypothetical protein